MGAYERGESPVLLAADGITDVRNLGAIARSAECFGVHGLIIPERGSASITDGAIKSSSGALLRLPVCRVGKITDALNFLNTSGVSCVALSEKAKQSIDYNKVSGPFLKLILLWFGFITSLSIKGEITPPISCCGLEYDCIFTPKPNLDQGDGSDS